MLVIPKHTWPLLYRKRRAEQIALCMMASEGLNKLSLLLGLNSFGNQAKAKTFRKLGNGGNDAVVDVITCQSVYKRLSIFKLSNGSLCR